MEVMNRIEVMMAAVVAAASEFAPACPRVQTH